MKAFADAAFDDVFKMNNTEDFVALGNHQRRAAGIGDSMRDALDFGADGSAQFLNVADDRFDRALADVASIEIAAAHAGFSAEGNKARADLGHVAPAQPVFFLGEHDDRSSFRRLVGQAR